ncbi:MAG: hypothetical protein MJ151_04180 [Lachnospiraceae bacterium]|nr:hypothetical protein [Lachnospiraceae bacterium]
MDNKTNVQNEVTNAGTVVEKKKKDSFLLYAILAGIVTACVFIGPIIFVILGTTSDINAKGKVYNPLEKEYILSVCVVTLIVCGISLILVVSTLIYKMINKKKKVVA